MEHFKFIKILCISLLFVFFLEISNYTFIRNYLINESYLISSLINKSYGVSDELMKYLYNQDYEFIYHEDNKNYEGNLVSYTLKKQIDSLFLEKKEIEITQSLVLGSFI